MCSILNGPKFLGLLVVILALGVLSSQFLPFDEQMAGLTLLFAVGLITREVWPKYEDITFNGLSDREEQERSGEIAKMVHTIENASQGSVFSRNELSLLLKQALMSKRTGYGHFSENSIRELSLEDLAKLTSRSIPAVLGIFFTTAKSSPHRRLKFRGSTKYILNLEKALAFVERVQK